MAQNAPFQGVLCKIYEVLPLRIVAIRANHAVARPRQY
jgi:hypothetical protein